MTDVTKGCVTYVPDWLKPFEVERIPFDTDIRPLFERFERERTKADHHTVIDHVRVHRRSNAEVVADNDLPQGHDESDYDRFVVLFIIPEVSVPDFLPRGRNGSLFFGPYYVAALTESVAA